MRALGLLLVLASIVHGQAGADEGWPTWHPLREERQVLSRDDPAPAMNAATYERLSRAHELLADEQPAEALGLLTKLSSRGMNNYERALVEQTLGHTYSVLGDDPRAFEAFEKCVEFDILPTPVQQSIKYSLASYYASLERYSTSNDMMMRWFRYQETPRAEAYLLMGTNHLQDGELLEGLPYVRRANALADPPREPWKQTELAILFELRRYLEAIDLLEDMVHIWPDRVTYYSALSGLLMETDQEARALSALMLPWLRGLLRTSEDILTLVRLNLYLDDPDRAATILARAIEQEYVPATEEHLELLLGAWTGAREMEQAVLTIDRLAQLSDDGEYYLRKAQLLNASGDWQAAVQAAREALEKGGLEQPGDAWILAGVALSELERYPEALDAFEGARREGGEDARRSAASWIAYVRDRSG